LKLFQNNFISHVTMALQTDKCQDKGDCYFLSRSNNT